MTVKLIMFTIFSNHWSFLFITSEMSVLFWFVFCFAKVYYIVTSLRIFFFVVLFLIQTSSNNKVLMCIIFLPLLRHLGCTTPWGWWIGFIVKGHSSPILSSILHLLYVWFKGTILTKPFLPDARLPIEN